jgi:alkylated DNA repair dioxygenase AlkB
MSTTQRDELADGGILVYYPHFLSTDEADDLFATLKLDTPWKQETGSFGRPFPRLTAYYADEGVIYRYSGVTHPSLPWPDYLADLRQRIEDAAGALFNSLLLNYYRDGNDSIGYHTDAEPELGINPIVPSLSLGASRRFLLRHMTTKELRTFDLTHGSLLIMAGTTQHHWQHSVPKTKEAVGERINLTFRNITAPDTRGDNDGEQ